MMSEEDEDHFELRRPLAAAVQVAGLGDEVWGDQYLKTLGRSAKWTCQQWLSYLHPAAGCAKATILQGYIHRFWNAFLCGAANDGSHVLWHLLLINGLHSYQ